MLNPKFLSPIMKISNGSGLSDQLRMFHVSYNKDLKGNVHPKT